MKRLIESLLQIIIGIIAGYLILIAGIFLFAEDRKSIAFFLAILIISIFITIDARKIRKSAEGLGLSKPFVPPFYLFFLTVLFWYLVIPFYLIKRDGIKENINNKLTRK